MADKRISQLVDRGTVANNDVVPIVVSGAVTTNKATISSIQTFMQGNLDLGVTSVGITFGTSGTDINASGSPVTSSGNITINLPTASATNRGALSSADWITFNAKQPAGNYVTLDTVQTITAQKTFTGSGSSDTVIISHGSGSGFALDVIKAGSGEAIRVQKTSGSGNAMTISGGNFEAPTIVKTGGTSTQYLMADGSTSTLTNPVTGTGTAGQVAYWSSGSAITGESNLFWDSANDRLGLGIASPTVRLDVDSNVTNAARFVGAGDKNFWIYGDSGGIGIGEGTGGAGVSNYTSLIYLTSDSTTRFYTGGTERWRISSTGILQSNGAQTIQTSTGNLTLATAGGNGNILLSPNGTGNVGINTATPSSKLEISQSSTGNLDYLTIYNTGGGAVNDQTALSFEHGGGRRSSKMFSTLESSTSTALGFVTTASSVEAERWRMTSAGILQSNGAQTIQTSTGNLTLATAAGNGNIVLNAHGDGNVTTNDSIFIGSTSGINYGGLSNKLSIATTNYNLFDISRFSNDNDGARLYLGKSRGSTVGSNVIVQNGDLLGTISFEGDCGEGMVPAASISAEVDGVPGLTSDMPGRLIFRTCSDNTIFAAERMRITSTGNVGIGTASPNIYNLSNAAHLTLSTSTANYAVITAAGSAGNGGEIDFGNQTIRHAAIASLDGSNLGFYINGTNSGTGVTERMRITSVGAFKASNTGNYLNVNAAYHELRQGTADTNIAICSNTTATPFGLDIRYPNASPNSTNYPFISCEDSTQTKFFVYSNGNVVNRNNSYGAISDVKLKENIEDATPKLDDLLKVKVRNYNLIGDDKKQIGVIAQELEEVFPAMIDESEDFEEVEVPQLDEEGNEVLNEEGEVVTTKEKQPTGTTTKSVKYSVFVPMLIKAIQEQQEIINEMRAEIDSLKNQIK